MAYAAYSIIILFVILDVLAEAWVMYLGRYNRGRKCLIDSLAVNFVSLGMTLAMKEALEDFSSIDIAGGSLKELLILFGITVIIESLVLYLLNRHKKFRRTFLICVLMNIITYLMLYLLWQSRVEAV